MENQTDHDLDQKAMDADDYYQDIVVEDAASMPDGCLGVIGFAVVAGTVASYFIFHF